MDLEFVPLLQIQRDLYQMPRGVERFHAYLRTMTDRDSGDLALPLVSMNPMGKDHIPALLDAYLELGADEAGAAATAFAGERLRGEPGRFKVGLVMADDAHGRWTNRYTYEFAHRFSGRVLYKRGWIVGQLWTSEPAALGAVREEVLSAIHRAAYIQRHGPAPTLGAMLAQEGAAMAFAGSGPSLEPDDLEYTREVIAPLLDASDTATVMTCLFGDECARTLGYPPQGLTDRAGLALALALARSGQAQVLMRT